MRSRREDPAPILASLAIALLIHGAILLPGLADALLRPSTKAQGDRVRIVAMTKAQWEQNRRILDEAKPKPPRPREEKKPAPPPADEAPVPPGQVVALPPPQREERPDQADYAAEHDQVAERETRSRHQTQDMLNPTRAPQDGLPIKRAAPPSPTTRNQPVVDPRTPGGPLGPGRATEGASGTDETSGEGEQMFALEIPRQAPRQGLQLKVDPQGLLANREAREGIDGNSDQARLAMGRAGDMGRQSGEGGSAARGQGLQGGAGRDGLPGLEALTPSLGQLERIAGMPANDHLPEVETDAETRLNAWRWKHSTFFNRIADAIRRTWQGGDVLTSTDPTGTLYGFSDRMTVVQVTLDRKGNVVELAVAEPSGALALDDEALRAFRAAGPFSNPPEGLFRGEDRFTFLFGFNISYARSNFDLNWRPY